MHPDLRKRPVLNRICIWMGVSLPLLSIVIGLMLKRDAIESGVYLLGASLAGAFFIWAGLCLSSCTGDQQQKLALFKSKANQLFYSTEPHERNIVIKMLECGQVRVAIVFLLPRCESEAPVAFSYALGDSTFWIPPSGRLTAMTRVDDSASMAIFELFGHRMWCEAPSQYLEGRIAHDLKMLTNSGSGSRVAIEKKAGSDPV